MTFILSDNSINSYGFRVLTNGINLERFKSNPIMLWMHQRDDGFFSDKLPIGRWENIRIEDEKLLADPVFDDQDEFAVKVKSKVDRHFIKAVSIGIDVIETSSEKEVMEKGQVRPTITKSEMFEASIVDIPANKNAVRLFMNGQRFDLPKLNNQMSTENQLFKDESSLMAWFKQTFGLKTKDESDAEINGQKLTAATNEIERLKNVISDKDAEIAKLTSEKEESDKKIIDLTAENETLKTNGGDEHTELNKSTDNSSKHEETDDLSMDDIKLFNQLKK